MYFDDIAGFECEACARTKLFNAAIRTALNVRFAGLSVATTCGAERAFRSILCDDRERQIREYANPSHHAIAAVVRACAAAALSNGESLENHRVATLEHFRIGHPRVGHVRVNG